MARKKQQKPWQYKFSFGLVFVLLLLIFGYFAQSFRAVLEFQPVRVALERLQDAPAAPEANDKSVPGNSAEGKGTHAE